MPNTLPPRSQASGSSQLVLSLGAAHVAGAVVGRSGDRVTVTRYAREELNPDPEGDGDWPVRAGKALARLTRLQHWRGAATLLLPGHLTLTKRIRTPAVGGAGRETAMLFAAQQNLPDALSNLTWDGVVLSDDGADLDLLLGAARASVVEAVVDAVTRADLKVGHIRPHGLPPPGPWLAPGESGVFVNIGARSTLLFFRWPDGWWTRRIGTAGNSVTRLMARALDADFAIAQRLKHAPAAELNDPGLAAIRRAAGREFVELLAAEIRRTALTFGCCGGGDRPRQLWITGGGSRLPGLVPALAEVMDRPVHVAECMPGPTIFPPSDQAGLADLLAAGAGGGVAPERGASPSAGPAGWPDLLPWRMKLAQSVARRRRGVFVAVALLALAPFPVAWGYGQRTTLLAREEAWLEHELGPRRREVAAQRALVERLAAGRAELAAWERLDAQAAGWMGFLGGLEAAVAEVGGVWLERLAPVAQAAPRTGKAPGGPRQIALGGRLRVPESESALAMTTASARMRRLTQVIARLPEVTGVTGERFDRRGGDELRFECVLNLKPEAIL